MKPQRYISTRRTVQNENGVVLGLVALLIGIFVGIAALVVDVTKHEVNTRELQNAADAASLAMAVKLDGTLAGWHAAKIAAVEVLKQHKVMGKLSDLEISMSSAPSDVSGVYRDAYMPSNPSLLYNAGRVGDLTIRIERGMLTTKDREREAQDTEINGFLSLEGKPSMYSHKSYHLANAATVLIQVNDFRSFFARVFGQDRLPDVTVSAAAAYDNLSREPLAPFAIPACQMLYDPDGHDPASLPIPDKKTQCHREIIISEAKVLQNPFRGHGLVRYEAYLPYSVIRLPDSSYDKLSFSRIEMFGTLGIYDEGTPPYDRAEKDDTIGGASMPELLDALDTQQGQAQVKLGSRFKPIIWGSREHCTGTTGHSDNCSNVDGPLNPAHDQRLGSALKEIISGPGSAPYGTQFAGCSTDIYSHSERSNRCPELPTYPTPRFYSGADYVTQTNPDTGEPETRIEPRFGWTWMPGELPGTYTNPLCHDPRLAANDSNRGMRRLRVGLIAPGDDRFKYCEWGESGELALPVPKTKPTLVGSVEVVLMDFNFSALDENRVSNQYPQDKRPAGWLVDDKHIPQHCMRTPLSAVRLFVTSVEEGLFGVQPGSLGINTVRDYCRMLPRLGQMLKSAGLPGLDTPPPGTDVVSEGHSCAQVSNSPPQTQYTALPNIHCLPVYRGGCDVRTNPWACWYLQHWVPQYGCGGIQARLSCNDEAFPAVNRRGEERPVLMYLKSDEQ